MDPRLLAFIGVAALLTITPGADMALVTRTALARGRQAALFTALGINAGLLAWGIASGIGLAALLAASATAFTVLKLAGAAYLIVLGLRTLWQARARSVAPAHGGEHRAPGLPPAAGSAAFMQGLVNNLLNPKIGIFYTTFLPQFIAPGEPVLSRSVLLAGIHIVLGLLWLSGYAYAVTRAGDVLRRPRVKQVLDRLTGTVLLAFGLRLALDHR
jgi:threonine/homoserine/homoserine lactone efflux protein